MINADFKIKQELKKYSITIITEYVNLELKTNLKENNFNVHCMSTIPNQVELWEVSPDIILIDAAHSIQWELFIKTLKDINEYKEVPIILLINESITIENTFSILEKGIFSCVKKNNFESIHQTIVTAIKYWFNLKESSIKTNQLNRTLSTNYLNLDSKNEYLEKVKKKIDDIAEESKFNLTIAKELTVLSNSISNQLKQSYHHDLFKAHFEEVHPLFYKKLLLVNKDLTNNDLKLASFIKMGFNNSEISFFLGISMAGVKKAIQRIKVRLMIMPKESLRQFIFNIDV